MNITHIHGWAGKFIVTFLVSGTLAGDHTLYIEKAI